MPAPMLRQPGTQAVESLRRIIATLHQACAARYIAARAMLASVLRQPGTQAVESLRRIIATLLQACAKAVAPLRRNQTLRLPSTKAVVTRSSPAAMLLRLSIDAAALLPHDA
eukprot:4602787-Pleurochrysis_carterae.AAC.1